MTVPPGYDPSDYPPFAVTADAIVFTVRGDELYVVLIERANEPFKGKWAIPGGFVDEDEDLPDGAARELEEETGLTVSGLVQLGAYGKPGRDPRMRVVTVAFTALVPDLPTPRSGSDAAAVMVVPVEEALSDPDRLATDHYLILSDAVARAREAI